MLRYGMSMTRSTAYNSVKYDLVTTQITKHTQTLFRQFSPIHNPKKHPNLRLENQSNIKQFSLVKKSDFKENG